MGEGRRGGHSPPVLEGYTFNSKESLARAAEQAMVAKMLLFLARHQEAEHCCATSNPCANGQLGADASDTASDLNNLARLL